MPQRSKVPPPSALTVKPPGVIKSLRKYHSALLGLALAFLVWEGLYYVTKRAPQSGPLEVRLSGFVPSTTPVPQATPVTTELPAPKTMLNAPAEYYLEQRRFTINGDRLAVPFLLKWGGARKGELQSAVRQDLTGKKVYLSIESLVDGTKKPALARVEIPEADFLSQVQSIVNIPWSGDIRHLGVFICTDRLPDANCQDKEMPKNLSTTGGSAQGRTYFFAYLMTFDDLVMRLDYSAGEMLYRGLKRAAMMAFYLDSPPEVSNDERMASARKLTETVERFDAKLRPYGMLQGDSGGFAISLGGAS